MLTNGTTKHQLGFDFRTFQILRKLGIFKAQSSWCFIGSTLSRKKTLAVSREFHSISPQFSLELGLLTWKKSAFSDTVVPLPEIL